MTIEPALTPEVLAKNIREFESQGADRAEVRANFLEQGGSPAIWERAEEIIAAENLLVQQIPPPPPSVPAARGNGRKWIIVAVLLVLVGTAGWWAWTGLQKNSFDVVIDRVQQLISSPTPDAVDSSESVPIEIEFSTAAPAETQNEELEIISEELPSEPVQGVRRRPRPSGS